MNVKFISYRFLLYTVIYLFNECGVTYAEKLKICVVESIYTNKTINKICPNMKIAPFECSIARDRFDCLRQLSNHDADITLLQAEDLLAVSMNKFDFLTTHEIRLFPEDKQQFEMVALVQQNIDSEWDFKGKRFCHPGFETTDTYTKALSMYFENRIIPKECDPEKTLLENRVARLSNYFEAACIAGPWIADAELDRKLKSKYRNLCSLCYNPASCSIDDKYHGREGAILCLTDNVGDIAWVRLDDVIEYFKMTESNKDDYSYLCPDGMTRPAKDNNPCIWLGQPWPIVVSTLKMANKAVNMINLTINSNNVWKNTLQDLLAPHSTFVSTEALHSPNDYLQRSIGFLSAYNRATCKPSRRVRWCISSNIEDRKCRWLRDASFVYGIEPSISCIQESNRISCLEAVRNQEADIFVSRPEERLQVSKKELKPIMQVTSNQKNDLNRIVAIVKRNSPYKSLKDLKGAKACFTGYESIGWNAFVTIMKNISKDSWDCSNIKAVGNFFGDSCIPGLSTMKTDVPRNLYSLCIRDANVENDINTFSCLTSGRADVVFVNLQNVQKEFNITNLANEKYKILCREETQTEIEETCSLTRFTLAAIVAHKNITDLRRDEIYSMFLNMDQLFGTSTTRYTRAFSLYGTYDGVQNVIFPEGSERLQLEVNKIHRISNYDDIIEEMIKSTCNSAQNLNSRFDKINLLGLLILIMIFTLN
ncbi:PREDICTED: transferrin [Polistes canadensis]|uniref:transferrin n=1 Tax=Polistes canadensis TaxID=91411 RepID=UPI000718AF5A|nr:PREDICTED: transferrin [Polistes canadensis]